MIASDSSLPSTRSLAALADGVTPRPRPHAVRRTDTLDNLVWIHEKLANGPTQRRWKDHDVFAYERLGAPHLLVGLNNRAESPRSITVDTGFGPNAILHDYTGHGGDVRTDDRGRVTITIPRNDGGRGHVCYSRAGIGGDFAIQGHSVTQDYEGAQDLDIPPADSMRFVQVCRVWAAQGRPIRASLRYDTSAWTNETSLVLHLTDPTGSQIESRTYTLEEQGEALDAIAVTTGWYTFRIRSVNPPAANPKPSYKLTVTYQAPQEMIDSRNAVASEGTAITYQAPQEMVESRNAVASEGTAIATPNSSVDPWSGETNYER